MAPSGQPSSQPSNRPSGQPSHYLQHNLQPNLHLSLLYSLAVVQLINPVEILLRVPHASHRHSHRHFQHVNLVLGQRDSVISTFHETKWPTVERSNDGPNESTYFQPSMQPSSQPTGIPTQQPFGAPTSNPSNQPTSRPSMQPSSQPSTQPSSTIFSAVFSTYTRKCSNRRMDSKIGRVVGYIAAGKRVAYSFYEIIYYGELYNSDCINWFVFEKLEESVSRRVSTSVSLYGLTVSITKC